jgi:hypothetical protein
MVTTLHSVAAVATGVLKIFRLVFPTRFQLVDLDAEIVELVSGLNLLFKPFVPAAEAPGE